MACCTPTAQKFWLTGCSAGALVLALALGLLWPTISLKYFLYPQLVLKEGSVNYENWKQTPIPIYLDIFFFNWTNHEDVIANNSIKPHFTEMGPYSFKEEHIRTNLTWNSNGTITFYQKRIWEFSSGRSNGSLLDEVTNLNVIATTVAYSSRYFNSALKLAISLLMSQGRAPIITTKTVQELLFDGYSDDLLTLVRANGNPDIPKPPFSKFGWFVERNDSYTYDGNFTMFTGETDIEKLGVLQLWNSRNTTGLYRGSCDKVKGTTGELWPPIEGQKPPLTVFATDICRSVTVKYDSNYEKFGIKGYKWVADDSVFDNGEKYPEMSCYCSADEESCPDLLQGIFNASSCKFGAPAFVSFPHFYLAHEHYREAVDGLQPSKEKHEFSVAMEPRTGIPLNVNAQLQINLLMKSYPWTSFKNVPEVMMPMFWFRQVAELSEDLAAQAKIAVYLPDIGVWVAYFLASIGVLLIIVFASCYVFRWRKVEEDEEILT